MDLVEISEKERLSREDTAVRPHALVDALARNNEVEFNRGGLPFKVHVPDQVGFTPGWKPGARALADPRWPRVRPAASRRCEPARRRTA